MLTEEVFSGAKSVGNGTSAVPLIRIIDNGEYRRKSMPTKVASFEC
jgi:hypothetical protein